MSAMKNILYITPYLPFPNNKAANNFISKRLELLSKKFSIDLLSVTNGKYDTAISESKIAPYIREFDFIIRKKASINCVIKSFLEKESPFITLSYELLGKIEEKFSQNEYEYIIFEHSYIAAMVLKKSPQLANKSIIVFHNIESDYFEYLYKILPFYSIGKYQNFLEYRANKKYEEFLASSAILSYWFLSTLDLDKFKKLSGKDNMLLSPAIKFNPKLGEKEIKTKNDVTYFGQLDNDRNLFGIDWFMKNVWKNLQEQRLKLTFGGRGNLEKLESITHEYKNINLAGEINDLQEFFDSSKVSIIPIFDSIGVQTKIFDALSFCKIIICTPDTIKGTLFKDKKHVFVAKNKKEFEKLIIEITTNIESYSYIKENIIEVSKNFSDESLLNKMLEAMGEK